MRYSPSCACCDGTTFPPSPLVCCGGTGLVVEIDAFTGEVGGVPFDFTALDNPDGNNCCSGNCNQLEGTWIMSLATHPIWGGCWWEGDTVLNHVTDSCDPDADGTWTLKYRCVQDVDGLGLQWTFRFLFWVEYGGVFPCSSAQAFFILAEFEYSIATASLLCTDLETPTDITRVGGFCSNDPDTGYRFWINDPV